MNARNHQIRPSSGANNRKTISKRQQGAALHSLRDMGAAEPKHVVLARHSKMTSKVRQGISSNWWPRLDRQISEALETPKTERPWRLLCATNPRATDYLAHPGQAIQPSLFPCGRAGWRASEKLRRPLCPPNVIVPALQTIE